MSKEEYMFRNTRLNIMERVESLVGELNLEEKISQMCHTSAPIPRLGIPAYNWWNECLHGVARAGLATVFPQAIGLAAIFDAELIHEIATAISDEARAKHHAFASENRREIYQGLTYWTPNINICRDPRWGRGMETYGEDPYLTSRIAVSFVKGLQGDDKKYLKLVATPKHFAVHSGPESLRHEFNAVPTKKDLFETYLPAFKACVMEAKAQSVMGAYNRLHGEACCASPFLLTHLLREEWGFDGYVVSDCLALLDIYAHHKIVKSPAEAAALAIKAGNDLNCGHVFCDLIESVKLGLVKEEEIDQALKRLFKARFDLGMFDPDEMNPYANIPYDVVDQDKHKDLAHQAAIKSMVLLKNQNNLLPLDKGYKNIAVIGPHATDDEVYLGNYHGTPSRAYNLLESLQEHFGGSCNIIHEQGCPLADELPLMQPVPPMFLFRDKELKNPGLDFRYWSNTRFEGIPDHVGTVEDLNYMISKKFGISHLSDIEISLRWEGYFVPGKTGVHALGVSGMNSVRFWFEGEMMEDFSNIYEPEDVYFNFDLQEGQPYHIKIEMYSPPGDVYQHQLIFSGPDPGMRERAVEAAKKSDLVILNLGLSSKLEGEEHRVHVEGFNKGDRVSLDLPAVQEELLKSIHETGKPVVLVLYSGSAVSINYAMENLPAILLAWYPGQAAGKAITDVLFGKESPSGKLPVTFYKDVNDLPPFEDYSMEGRTYRYFRKEPLVPFGFGLSYPTFSYKNIMMERDKLKPEEGLALKVEVSNEGKLDGEEVVQVYVKALEPSFATPVYSLKAFKRVKLAAGQTKQVGFTLDKTAFEVYNDEGVAINENGRFKIFAGGSSPSPRSLTLGASMWAEKDVLVSG